MGSKFVTEKQLPLVSKTLVTSTSVRFDRFTNNFRNIKSNFKVTFYANTLTKSQTNTPPVYNNSSSDLEIVVLAKKSNRKINFVERATS